jgi:ABC-type xylose transport system permease subunit
MPSAVTPGGSAPASTCPPPTSAFVVCSGMAGLAGVVAARTASIDGTGGNTLPAVAAAVIGGTSLFGGRAVFETQSSAAW